MRAALCDLRASSIASLLRVKREEDATEAELVETLDWLRGWDQLSLANVIELVGNKFPPGGLAPLSREAAIELKWFQEWQLAAVDPRIYKIPGLPWRRFLRKINEENFAFAVDVLKLTGEELVERVQGFLDVKKRTVSLFPKRWN